MLKHFAIFYAIIAACTFIAAVIGECREARYQYIVRVKHDKNWKDFCRYLGLATLDAVAGSLLWPIVLICMALGCN